MKKEYITTHSREYNLSDGEVRKAISAYLISRGEVLDGKRLEIFTREDGSANVKTIDKIEKKEAGDV